MSEQEWLSIPEANDYGIKKQKKERYMPVPDNIILDAAKKDGEMSNSISVSDAEGIQSSIKNLNEVGEARGFQLSQKLDQMSDSVTG